MSSTTNKRKLDVVDLSDDTDEIVYDFIESCNEESILKLIIEKATDRLSYIGLGVVMKNHCSYDKKSQMIMVAL